MITIELIFALTFGIIGLVIFSIGKISRGSEKGYDQECKFTIGKIVGYRQMQDSRFEYLEASFFDGNKEVITDCKTSLRNVRVIPLGSDVRITYRKKRVLGMQVYDVRMADEGYRPLSMDKLGKILYFICSFFLIFALIFIIIYIKNKYI